MVKLYKKHMFKGYLKYSKASLKIISHTIYCKVKGYVKAMLQYIPRQCKSTARYNFIGHVKASLKARLMLFLRFA